MSRHGEVTRPFGDGEYVFRLGIGEWEKIDERFGIGPYELLKRLSNGTWRAAYLPAVTRLCLIAGASVRSPDGKVDDQRINRLVREYVEERPLLPTAIFLAGLVNDILTEPQDDQPPKQQPAEAANGLSQTEGSPSPDSTDGGPSSDTRPKKSGRSRSGNTSRASPDTVSRTSRSSRRPPQAPLSSTT